MISPARKILILKTGFTETFSTDIQDPAIVSLGDILRTTPILKAFTPSDQIIWVTSSHGLPLLEKTNEISELWDYETYLEKKSDLNLDLFLNLERYIPREHFPPTKLTYGYGSVNDDSLMTSKGVISLKDYKESFAVQGKKIWQHLLFGLLGLNYQRETYCFFSDNTQFIKNEKPIIGLNWQVGSKWPTKKIDLSSWKKLAHLIEEQGYQVSWQEGHDNLETYINWISECDFLITCDSLGLHIALGMKKKFIAFFGPTPSDEIDFYQVGTCVPFLIPENYHCLPCHQSACHQPKLCSEFLDYPKVLAVIQNEFNHE